MAIIDNGTEQSSAVVKDDQSGERAEVAAANAAVTPTTVVLRVQNIDASGAVSAGGGQQYTEGDVDTTITGIAVMWEDTGDTLRAVSAAKPLPVADAALAGFVDGVEALLTTIRDNADSVEALLTSLGTNTDGVEALLTTIRDNADTVEASLTAISGFVDGLEGFTDGLETLIGTSNANLATLIGHVDGLEGFTDGIEGALTTLAGYVDGLEGFVDGVELSLADIATYTGALNGKFATAASPVDSQVNATVITSDIHAFPSWWDHNALTWSRARGSMAFGLEVDVMRSALPSGAASEATLADIRTALQIIDDWDETDRAKVNPIAGQAGVQGSSGNVTALTQRVVLATDQPALTTPMPATETGNTATTLGNGAQTAVDTSADQILAADSTRKWMLLQNLGTVPMYVGGSGVTATTGIRVRAGDTIQFSAPFCPTNAIFAITASGSTTAYAVDDT